MLIGLSTLDYNLRLTEKHCYLWWMLPSTVIYYCIANRSKKVAQNNHNNLFWSPILGLTGLSWAVFTWGSSCISGWGQSCLGGSFSSVPGFWAGATQTSGVWKSWGSVGICLHEVSPLWLPIWWSQCSGTSCMLAQGSGSECPNRNWHKLHVPF